jgi:hypothetical protein
MVQLKKDRSQPHSSVPRDCFLRASLPLPHGAKKPANSVTTCREVSGVVHRKFAVLYVSLVACYDSTVKEAHFVGSIGGWRLALIRPMRPLLASMLPSSRGMNHIAGSLCRSSLEQRRNTHLIFSGAGSAINLSR